MKNAICYAVLAIAICGCDSGGSLDPDDCRPDGQLSCWVPMETAQTGVVPSLGRYKAVGENGEPDIGAIGSYGFEVERQASTGAIRVVFAADGWNRLAMEVVSGAFSYVHGGGKDYSDCPTDGFVISGSFVSPTEARGHYRDMYCEEPGGGGYYVATLQ